MLYHSCLINVKYTPLLQLQRNLYAIPRGYERFNEYIATMVGDTDDLELPLSAMNPMGKDHIPALLDDYLTLDADTVAATAVSHTHPQHQQIAGNFRATLVIADDAMGMWTNRYVTEFGHRFESKPMHRRGWRVGLLWTSEAPNLQNVRDEILTTVFRGVYIQQNGYAQNLGRCWLKEDTLWSWQIAKRLI